MSPTARHMRSVEERANAPADMMFSPLNPATATLDQIAEAVNRTHDCIHATGEALGGKIDDLANTVKKDRHAALNRDHKQELLIARIQGALGVSVPSDEEIERGVRPRKVKPKLAGVSRLQAAGWLFGAAASAAGLYKYVFPMMEAGLSALHQALMAG